MGFLYSQLFITPPIPFTSLDGQTIIVTGSNTGLGFTAAEHIARLNPTHLILAVRNASKGEAARSKIIASTGIAATAISVWLLDMSKFESVLSFADRCASDLDRLDGVSLNAGIDQTKLELFEGYESTLTVNVISTMLLALALQPTLLKTAEKYRTLPRLSFVASEVHAWARFAEKDLPSDTLILEAMSQPDKAKDLEYYRYMDSKLLEVLLFRHVYSLLVAQPERKGDVVWNILNPGFCHSELSREGKGLKGFIGRLMKLALARTQEMGGRPVAAGVVAGKDTDGVYMHDGVVADEALSQFVKSKEGEEIGRRLWQEVRIIYERTRPGVTNGL